MTMLAGRVLTILALTDTVSNSFSFSFTTGGFTTDIVVEDTKEKKKKGELVYTYNTIQYKQHSA